MQRDAASSLSAVAREELQYIADYRRSRGAPAHSIAVPPDGASLEECRKALFDAGGAALCLSGGGIRSATFNLGLLQGLASKGLLDKFDYLSTVSGGGYVGAWLTSWAFRAGGIGAVSDSLTQYAKGGERRVPAGRQPPHPIDWLRDYSHYLTPMPGLASIDTWTVLVTYARNLAVNWLALVPMLMILLMIPAIYAGGLEKLAALEGRERLFTLIGVLVPAALLLLVGERNSFLIVRDKEADSFSDYVRRVNLPFFGGVVLFASAWAIAPRDRSLEAWLPVLAAFGCALVCAGNGLRQLKHNPGLPRLPGALDRISSASLMSGLVALGALGLTFYLTSGERWRLTPDAWWPIIVLPVFIFGALLLGDFIHIAFTSRDTSDEDRERWARSGAWFTILTFVWLAWTSLALVAPKLLANPPGIPAWVDPHVLSGAVTAALGAVLAKIGRSSQTPAQRPPDSALSRWLLPLGILLFVVGVLALLASANVWLMWTIRAGVQHVISEGQWIGAAACAVGVVFMLAVIYLVWQTVDVNRFSLHAMYRDRVVRAYLGAAREDLRGKAALPPPAVLQNPQPAQFESFGASAAYRRRWLAQASARKPNPFTGFDDADNPDLFWFGLPEARRQPLWLVNMALNIVDASGHLGWQERKAASFTASPLHCGSWITGYRPSMDYGAPEGGISVGTAVAISGAAASPNMGYHSSPTLTFLMTFLNVRLGWWLGNPMTKDSAAGRRDAAYRWCSPKFGIWHLFRELLGKTNETNDWLHLSDGGHFDNLGIYEVIMRGCRFIVVSDASADPARSIDDFGRTIRNVRSDLGVDIRHVGDTHWTIGARTLASGGAHALFDVHYPDGSIGRLLYIKPSVYDDDQAMPRDVWQYAKLSEGFPHESTLDQFFSESQFESYRALGEYQIRERVLSEVDGAFAGWGRVFDSARFRISLGKANIVKPPSLPEGFAKPAGYTGDGFVRPGHVPDLPLKP